MHACFPKLTAEMKSLVVMQEWMVLPMKVILFCCLMVPDGVRPSIAQIYHSNARFTGQTLWINIKRLM